MEEGGKNKLVERWKWKGKCAMDDVLLSPTSALTRGWIEHLN